MFPSQVTASIAHVTQRHSSQKRVDVGVIRAPPLTSTQLAHSAVRQPLALTLPTRVAQSRVLRVSLALSMTIPTALIKDDTASTDSAVLPAGDLTKSLFRLQIAMQQREGFILQQLM